MKTFEDYLKSQASIATKGFRLRVVMADEGMKFYIYPQDVNGETFDFRVSGNTLECLTKTGHDGYTNS